jgi:hypothetical protein
LVIACIFPLLFTLSARNTSTTTQSALLQEMNIQANSSTDCEFLHSVVHSWLVQADSESGGSSKNDFTHTVQWARVLPVRCPWQEANGVITSQKCKRYTPSFGESFSSLIQCFARETNVRVDEFTHESFQKNISVDFGNTAVEQFSVDVIFDNSRTVAIAYARIACCPIVFLHFFSFAAISLCF